MEPPHRLGRWAVRRYRTEGATGVLRVAPRHLVHRLVDEETRFRWRTALRYRRQQVRYRATADPWKRLWLDPGDLRTANYELSAYRGLGIVRDGSWDAPANNRPVDEYWSVQGIHERFVEGRPWEETRYYREAKRQIEEAGEFWGYSDPETFRRQRCEYVDALYEAIARAGYRSNMNTEHVVPEPDFKRKPHQHLEILVSIGRTGELLFRDGHHRIAICRILDVDTVPVNVLGRHREWQRTRDAVAQATSASELRDDRRSTLSHPDLDDLGAGSL